MGWTWRRSTRHPGERGPGRAAGNDAKILASFRLYATVDGVGSARALARLCGEHV